MKGATLIELMLALFITTLILSGLMTIYLSTKSINQVQIALTTIMENSNIAFHFLNSDIKTGNKNTVQPYYNTEMKTGSMALSVLHLTTNEINHYFIGKTARKNERGDSIYALYRFDGIHPKTELVEGVNDMRIQYAVLENNKIVESVEKEINSASKVVGISIMLTFSSINALSLQKNEYTYVSI